MGIQYSGAIIQETFSGATVNSILDGIHKGLKDAGWTELTRFRAHNTFTNLPFYANAGNGEIRGIGGETYVFLLSPSTGCPQVQILGAAVGTIGNWQGCINSVDPLFLCPFSGQVTVATDPLAPVYLYIIARNAGSAANNQACTLQSANFGQWAAPVTFGGGWEMQSLATSPGLQMRVQLVADFVNGALVPHIYVTSITEDIVSQPLSLTVANVTYTIVAGAHQFFIYQSGTTNQGTAFSTGNPYLYSVTQPQSILSITNPSGLPIICTTSAAHNLASGDRIQILEAQEQFTVTGSGISSFPNALGNTYIFTNCNLVNGDVIQLSGSGAGTDGYYQISNVIPPPGGVNPAGFTLNNTVGAGGLTGTVKGPAHDINGEWVVTVGGAQTFTLQGSSGSNFPYVGNSCLFAKAGHLARAIWAVGSDGSINFRTALRSDGNAQFIALNRASYNKLTNGDKAAPRFVYNGLPAQPLKYSDGCALLMEPLIAAGADGAGSVAQVFGQLWDAMIIAAAYNIDQTSGLDGNPISAYANDQGQNFSPINQGSLWIVT